MTSSSPDSDRAPLDLGYSHATGNPLHRAVRWGAVHRVPARLACSPTSLRHLDDAVGRVTRRTHGARPGLLAGLAGPRRDDDRAQVGTAPHQPPDRGAVRRHAGAARHQLRPGRRRRRGCSTSRPIRARRVTYRGVTREVVARAATPAEAEEVVALGGTLLPGATPRLPAARSASAADPGLRPAAGLTWSAIGRRVRCRSAGTTGRTVTSGIVASAGRSSDVAGSCRRPSRG